MKQNDGFREWAIVELMGHRRIGGIASDDGPGGMLRVEVFKGEGGPVATQFYSWQAVYCITPSDEATARSIGEFQAPVTRFALTTSLEEDQTTFG